jgi:hypothetical protein
LLLLRIAGDFQTQRVPGENLSKNMCELLSSGLVDKKKRQNLHQAHGHLEKSIAKTFKK